MPKSKYFKTAKPLRASYRQNMRKRDREVRDLFNKLRRVNTEVPVMIFFRDNYFMNRGAIFVALRRADRKPVDPATASIQYKEAIDPNFKL